MNNSEKWDRRFMSIAENISTWSKDPSTVVGAIAVSPEGQILATGYNGFPRGIEDTEERLNNRPTKYKYIVHAELNCILNAAWHTVSLRNATLYVHGLPVCMDCAKSLVQVGLKRIVISQRPKKIVRNFFKSEVKKDWNKDFDETVAFFKEAGIDFVELTDD